MFQTVLIPILLVLVSGGSCNGFPPLSSSLSFPYIENFTNNAPDMDCPSFQLIPNANVAIEYHDGIQFAQIICHENYSLFGRSIIYCESGQWKYNETPRCEKRCSPPPYLENGKLALEKRLEDLNSPRGTYLKGTLVRYSCSSGYILDPPTSHIRVCENGKWTGADAFCKPGIMISCPSPLVIENGIIDSKIPLGYTLFHMSQKVRYQCNPGYSLVGPSTIRCSENGVWQPDPPICQKDIVAPQECYEPPSIPYGIIVPRNFQTNYDVDGLQIFPIHSEITYICTNGYVLEGNPVLTCSINGCWEPADLPFCVRTKDYFIELSNINAILLSSATGAGVLGILFLACVVVACRKRKALARAVSIATPSSVATSRHHHLDVVNDHAALLQHPDRLALIAFADGIQNSQNSLPSYDEATRDRSLSSNLIQVNRLQIHRPHWPNLANCRGSGRNRSSPNTDSGSVHHVVRHGSFASHTPSMRSGGDSMGSTDTVTISEGSTNVTLDTASSHSGGSQNPSCRGHCGSLASFDGCSVINTDGVPLLEESELEEIQGGANDIDNPAASDNTSSKVSTHSAPVMTN